ncbi:MAG: hemolysin family protein [Anaerolineae bacterium]
MDAASISGLLFLITLHALITLAYAALTNTRQPLLREQTETGHDAPPRLHITYQLSLLLVRFGIAALALAAFADPVINSLTLSDVQMERALAYIIILVPSALLTLILGNLVPEAIATTRADSLARWSIYPMRLLIVALGPLVAAMMALSKWLAGIFGSGSKVNIFTEEEIMTMLDAGEKEGSIENDEKEMIYSVLQFGDKTASEMMIPRIDVVAVDITTLLDEALSIFIESGHSRIPVYEETVDNIKGLLYAKDLLPVLKQNDTTKSVSDLMRKAFFVPESKSADELLTELKSKKIHMAVVVDEYGGTAGVVTVEDLIEEIVGDIQDEYDANEQAEFVELGPNAYRVDAGISLTDFNDLLEVELPTEDANTLGGFLFTNFGRVPAVGETLEHGVLSLRVESLDGRRIRNVHITRHVFMVEADSEATTKNNSDLAPQTATQ